MPFKNLFGNLIGPTAKWFSMPLREMQSTGFVHPHHTGKVIMIRCLSTDSNIFLAPLQYQELQ